MRCRLSTAIPVLALIVFATGCRTALNSSAPRVEPETTETKSVETSKGSSEPSCELADNDRLFIEELVALFEISAPFVTGNSLSALPIMLFPDGDCVYEVGTGSNTVGTISRGQFRGTPIHAENGRGYQMPNGEELQPGMHSFTKMKDKPFFVLSLMKVWAKHPRASRLPNAAEFVLGIGLHELIHTIQVEDLQRAVVSVQREGDIVSDDGVQRATANDAHYVELRNASLELLWNAYAEKRKNARVRILRESFKVIAQRRALLEKKYPRLALYEGWFLNLEGLAEWSRTRAMQNAEALPASESFVALESTFSGWKKMRAATDEAIVKEIREQTKRSWTQEEGLVLMLLIDELVPDWRSRVIASPPGDLHALLQSVL